MRIVFSTIEISPLLEGGLCWFDVFWSLSIFCIVSFCVWFVLDPYVLLYFFASDATVAKGFPRSLQPRIYWSRQLLKTLNKEVTINIEDGDKSGQSMERFMDFDFHGNNSLYKINDFFWTRCYECKTILTERENMNEIIS